MTNIRVQSKVLAVEIEFGPMKSSLLFERSSEGGILVSVIDRDGKVNQLGSVDEERFKEFHATVAKL